MLWRKFWLFQKDKIFFISDLDNPYYTNDASIKNQKIRIKSKI